MQLSTILKKSIDQFNTNNCSQIAAALSYYSLFAIAPILFILFLVLELFLSDIQTQTTILTEIYTVFPTDIAIIIGNIIQNIVNYDRPNNLAGFISFAVLLVSSTTIVREIQKALNMILEVNHPNKITVSQRFQKRIIALIFLVFLGLLLLISFILNTLLNGLGEYLSYYMGFDPVTLYMLNIVVSLVTVSILFSLLFKYLPDIDLPWKNIILGGFITGMLFTIGKNIIGYILGHTNFGTLYGTTGTILILLIWVYYTSIIFLFGACLTYIIAKKES